VLTGLKWDLEKIEKTLAKSSNDSGITAVRSRIGTMTRQIESTIETVRRISSELRPGILDDLGLVAAIEWQAQEFQARTGIDCHWDSTLETTELNRGSATAVFRIFQEILTNVLRHSQAANVHIKLQTLGPQLELVVKDDGSGITESETDNPRSLGLLGMKERALLVGGEVSILGEIGKGTTVVVRVPAEA
jgi:signal transduction histidine kinase